MEDNPYGFFEFGNETSRELRSTFNAFKESNEKVMKQVAKKKSPKRRQSIRLNDGNEENFRIKNGLAAFDTSLLDLHKEVKIKN